MTQSEMEKKLREMGRALPQPPTPKGAYLPVVVDGRYAWVSGMLPLSSGKLSAEGLVDAEVDLSMAREAALIATLNGLSALNSALGGLDGIKRIVRVGVFVASSTGFVSQPEVANGASELLVDLFGKMGRHARVAIGAARLPLNSPVEVELHVSLSKRLSSREAKPPLA